MSRKRFTTEQIIHKLREAEVAKGRTIADVSKHLVITDQTYYRQPKGTKAASKSAVRLAGA